MDAMKLASDEKDDAISGLAVNGDISIIPSSSSDDNGSD